MPCAWGKTTIHNSSALRTGRNTATAQKKEEKVGKEGTDGAAKSTAAQNLVSLQFSLSSLCAIHTLVPLRLPWHKMPTPFLHNLFPNP